MNTTDIQKLAALSRLSISDDEAASLSKDMDGILDYIKQIESAQTDYIDEDLLLKNIVRDDVIEDTDISVTDAIIDTMPDKDGRFLKVKKIL